MNYHILPDALPIPSQSIYVVYTVALLKLVWYILAYIGCVWHRKHIQYDI